MKKLIIILMIAGISNLFSQDLSTYFLSDYFMRDTGKIYFFEKENENETGKVIVSERRSYRIIDLHDGGRGLIEDIEIAQFPMMSIVYGFAVYPDRIELSFVKSSFTEDIVNAPILKQPGEEWIVYKTDGEFEKYTASIGSITTKNATYDDCIIIKKEILYKDNELFATEYNYYAKNIGLVSTILSSETDGKGSPNELIGIEGM